MDAIANHPGADQATIAQLIAFDRATIGGVIDRLLQKGWIRRSVSEIDRRARVLELTAKGKRLMAELVPLVAELQAEVLAPLSNEEKAAFMALARKVMGHLEGE